MPLAACISRDSRSLNYFIFDKSEHFWLCRDRFLIWYMITACIPLCPAWHLSHCHILSQTESQLPRPGERGATDTVWRVETARMAAPGLWSGRLSVAHSPVPRVQLCPPVLCNAQYTVQLRRAHSEPRRMSLSLSLCLSPGLSPLSTHNLHTGHTITVLCTLLRQIR